jgi:hypothetical protein
MTYEPKSGDKVFFNNSPYNYDIAYTVKEATDKGILVSVKRGGTYYVYSLSRTEFDGLRPVKVPDADV